MSCYIWYKTIRSYYWLKFWIYSESLFIDLHFSMSDMLDITELYFVSISLNKIQTANYFPYKYVLVWSKIVREVLNYFFCKLYQNFDLLNRSSIMDMHW